MERDVRDVDRHVGVERDVDVDGNNHVRVERSSSAVAGMLHGYQYF